MRCLILLFVLICHATAQTNKIDEVKRRWDSGRIPRSSVSLGRELKSSGVTDPNLLAPYLLTGSNQVFALSAIAALAQPSTVLQTALLERLRDMAESKNRRNLELTLEVLRRSDSVDGHLATLKEVLPSLSGLSTIDEMEWLASNWKTHKLSGVALATNLAMRLPDHWVSLLRTEGVIAVTGNWAVTILSPPYSEEPYKSKFEEAAYAVIGYPGKVDDSIGPGLAPILVALHRLDPKRAESKLGLLVKGLPKDRIDSIKLGLPEVIRNNEDTEKVYAILDDAQ